MNTYSRAPKVGDTVIYFRPTTGKRTPAQITVVTNPTTVNLRLATGATLVGVVRQATRTTFNSWNYVRKR